MPSQMVHGKSEEMLKGDGIASLVFHLTLVVASATMSLSFEVLRSAGAGVTQLVECDLAKVDVAGSNPVSRSIPARHPKPWTDPHSRVPGPDTSDP